MNFGFSDIAFISSVRNVLTASIVVVPSPDFAWWKPTSITSPCTDSTGNGHDLTVQSGATFTTGPNGNGALTINGSEILQAFPGISTFANGTFAFWFKTTANTAASGYALWSIVDSSAGSFNGIVIYMVNSGQIGTAIKNGSTDSSEPTTANSGYNDGNWHHLALTFGQANGSTNSIYMDGALAGSAGPSTVSWTFNNQPLNIGNSQDSFWTIIPMTLADMRIYAEQLSGAVINQMYLNGAS